MEVGTFDVPAMPATDDASGLEEICTTFVVENTKSKRLVKSSSLDAPACLFPSYILHSPRLDRVNLSAALGTAQP